MFNWPRRVIKKPIVDVFGWHQQHIAQLTIGDKLADLATRWTGSFNAFIAAFFIVVIWGLLGPYYQYSDTPANLKS